MTRAVDPGYGRAVLRSLLPLLAATVLSACATGRQQPAFAPVLAVVATSLALVFAAILWTRNAGHDRDAAAARRQTTDTEPSERILPAAMRVLRRHGMPAAMAGPTMNCPAEPPAMPNI